MPSGSRWMKPTPRNRPPAKALPNEKNRRLDSWRAARRGMTPPITATARIATAASSLNVNSDMNQFFLERLAATVRRHRTGRNDARGMAHASDVRVQPRFPRNLGLSQRGGQLISHFARQREESVAMTIRRYPGKAVGRSESVEHDGIVYTAVIASGSFGGFQGPDQAGV